MSVQLVKDLMNLLDINANHLDKIPCVIEINEYVSLAVLLTDFDYISYTLILNNTSDSPWSESDVVEYFIDDETQIFIEKFNSCFSSSDETVGFSQVIKTEKIQIIDVSLFIQEGTNQLMRFIMDFTAS